MFDLTHLDQLSHQLVEAKRALESLNVDIGAVHMDPDNPVSVEAAIQRVEATIDARLAPYANNPIVAPLAQQLKAQHRAAILAQAASEINR